jgi:protein subunit release factor A
MSIETISKRLKILNDLQEELNKAKSLLEEKLEDDPSYQKFQQEQMKIKEETKEKKDKVMKTQTIKAMDEEVKNLRTEIKENKEILAMELADYYKDEGVLEIKDPEGTIKRIIFSAKLVNI